MDQRVVSAVSGAVVGVVAALLVGLLLLGQKERLETAISLDIDPATQTCRASDPIAFAVKGKKRLTWNIKNNCGEAQFVSIRQIKPKLSTGVLGPEETDVVTPYPVTTQTPIGVGQTVPLLATINKDHGHNSDHYFYKYEIWIGTTQAGLHVSRDPDIEMWDK